MEAEQFGQCFLFMLVLLAWCAPFLAIWFFVFGWLLHRAGKPKYWINYWISAGLSAVWCISLMLVSSSKGCGPYLAAGAGLIAMNLALIHKAGKLPCTSCRALCRQSVAFIEKL